MMMASPSSPERIEWCRVQRRTISAVLRLCCAASVLRFSMAYQSTNRVRQHLIIEVKSSEKK